MQYCHIVCSVAARHPINQSDLRAALDRRPSGDPMGDLRPNTTPLAQPDIGDQSTRSWSRLSIAGINCPQLNK